MAGRPSPSSGHPVRPPRLRPGDRVALVAPSSGPPLNRPLFRRALKGGIAFFEALELRPFLSRSATEDPGYLARDISMRAEDLSSLARDPDVRGIFCLSGGVSGIEILPEIDYGAFRADPKVLVGFSDAAGLLNAVTLHAGVVAFHGENVLWGGNLYTIRCLVGTPWSPSFEGAVFFWEETDEAADDLNAMLWQLRLAGVYERLSAMLIGDLPGMRRGAGGKTAEEIALRAFSAHRFPILKTRDFGHWRSSHILPIGVRARVDADKLEWEVEPGVS